MKIAEYVKVIQISIAKVEKLTMVSTAKIIKYAKENIREKHHAP